MRRGSGNRRWCNSSHYMDAITLSVSIEVEIMYEFKWNADCCIVGYTYIRLIVIHVEFEIRHSYCGEHSAILTYPDAARLILELNSTDLVSLLRCKRPWITGAFNFTHSDFAGCVTPDSLLHRLTHCETSRFSTHVEIVCGCFSFLGIQSTAALLVTALSLSKHNTTFQYALWIRPGGRMNVECRQAGRDKSN